MDIPRELALRGHIRTLLLDYSLTHLTTDYIAFTENAVAELLSSSLAPVPLADPTTPVLEGGTYECLQKVLKIDIIPPYDERWTFGQCASTYIKKCVSSRSSRPISSRCWDEQPQDTHRDLFRPMSPVLTRKAICETPTLGSLRKQSRFADNSEEPLQTYGIHSVKCEKDTHLPSVKIGDLPQMRFSLDSQVHASAMKMISTNPGVARVPASHSIIALAGDFLRTQTPPLEIPRLESPPIFSRDRNPGSVTVDPTSSRITPRSFDMPSQVEIVKVEEEIEVDMYKQHMLVVDGWQCYAAPSSPTPSLGTSSSQEVDELFLPSPPRVHGSYHDLLHARLDDYEIPRTEKFGGSREKPKRIGDGETLSSFLLPILKTKLPVNETTRTPSTPPSPRSAINASMVGQPPSVGESMTVEDSGNGGSFLKVNDGSDLYSVLKRLESGRMNQYEDPLDFIMKEKLDDKEAMLMDVPRLPPPNEHPPNGLFIPTTPQSLVAQSPKSTFGFLQRVKGTQSLNIELSWRPYNWNQYVPTEDEMARVTPSFAKDLSRDLGHPTSDVDMQIANLMDKVLRDPAMIIPDLPFASTWMEEGGVTLPFEPSHDSDNYILTREERRRLHGRPYPVMSDEFEHFSEDDIPGTPPLPPDSLEYSPRPSKRLRMVSRKSSLEHRPIDPADPALPSEDSGVYMAEPGYFHGDYGDSVFSVLSCEAEGAGDADVPRDMFPDLDDYYFLPSRHTNDLSGDQAEDNLYEYDYSALAFRDYPEDPIDSNPHNPSGNLENTNLEVEPELVDSGSPSVVLHPNAIPRRDSVDTADRHEQSFLAPGRQTLATFLELRAKNILTVPAPEEPTPQPDSPFRQILDDTNPPPLVVPHEIIDRFTICLPDSTPITRSQHRYMASIEVMSKRGLLRCFLSPHISIEVVERESLLGAHLILDPDAAVYLVPLPALPSRIEEHLDIIGKLSWQFLNVLVIFEAFPMSNYSKLDSRSTRGATSNPFSPPVIKSVKKLRRDLGVSEAFLTKNSEANIQYAFALDVEEVASYVRLYGQMAEGKDVSGGLLWGDREWLEVQEQDGEPDLALIQGMNIFASAMILSQVSLEEFLEWSPEKRVLEFGLLIGTDRIAQFNRILARRAEAMQLPSSSPVPTSLDTSHEIT